MWERWTFFQFLLKARRENHWQLGVEIFFLLSSLTWHFYSLDLPNALLCNVGVKGSQNQSMWNPPDSWIVKKSCCKRAQNPLLCRLSTGAHCVICIHLLSKQTTPLHLSFKNLCLSMRLHLPQAANYYRHFKLPIIGSWCSSYWSSKMMTCNHDANWFCGKKYGCCGSMYFLA